LADLTRFPIHYLEFDCSFVSAPAGNSIDDDASAIVKALLHWRGR